MYPQMTQIHPLTLISRDRLLPVPGEINVRPGQKVNPCDVVAQASIPSRHYLVDVGRVLGAQSADAAEKLITRKTGDLLEKNDIIAETGGMFSRVIRTPGPGRIVSIHKGRVLIEAESEVIRLKAALSGHISRVIADRGVSIEMYGALVQGVWGNGRIGYGPLSVEVSNLEGELTSSGLGVTGPQYDRPRGIVRVRRNVCPGNLGGDCWHDPWLDACFVDSDCSGAALSGNSLEWFWTNGVG